MPESFAELTDDLLALFRAGPSEAQDDHAPDDEVFDEAFDDGVFDDAFDEMARRIFAFQLDANPVYGAFCRGRGSDASSVGHWSEIPAVPTRAFKRFDLVSGEVGVPDAVFETSGTTRGVETRGRHIVRDLRLYHGSLLPTFRRHVLERGSGDACRPRLVSLIPHPEQAPRSSLSHMIGVVERELCAPGSGWFVDPERGLLTDELASRLSAYAVEGGDSEEAPGIPGESPILVVGTAFSFVHWIDSLDRSGLRYRLPFGSRVMETGGFKGRSRSVERGVLHGEIAERLGVGEDDIVNEYGMTELLSQFYSAAGAPHRGPPWLRTRILDPSTLEPVPNGTPGLLCHYDLANLGSVLAVLTEDLAVAAGLSDGDGFRLLGRAADAEPRGCSLAMDEILSVAGS